MKATIDHIGIAVGDLDASLAFFRDALGLELDAPEEVPSQRVRAHFLQAGEAAIELVEPTADDSPIAKFVAKRGPGIHHVCFAVDDLDATLDRCRAAGVRLIDEQPRLGAEGKRIAFLHPSATAGVLVELSEH